MELKVIKRDGKEVDYDPNKIYEAVKKANLEVDATRQLTTEEIWDIINDITDYAKSVGGDIAIEEIQDLVEKGIIEAKGTEVARKYIRYRYERELVRKANTTDREIKELLDGENDYWNKENSNKNATLVTTQRDYLAGITSADITKRFLLPKDIVKANEEGIIHFHDMDYFAQNALYNCCLINLEDMLQNGTVISGTLIERPHSFSTACNIATQIIAQVASSQYGGQTISLAHLAPFVNVSREKIRKAVIEEFKLIGEPIADSEEGHLNPHIEKIVEMRVKEEIKRGVQMIQYQIITLMTTNGQAPFLSIFMYLNECRDEQTKADLALVIEEVLKQRYQGVKNEQGVWITPSFPKLLYVTEEDNIKEDSKYYYLTELAAKCTAKRMVPDYISEKEMLRLKVDANGNGNCYGCMGCRSFLTPYVDKDKKPKYYGRLA